MLDRVWTAVAVLSIVVGALTITGWAEGTIGSIVRLALGALALLALVLAVNERAARGD